MNHFVRPLIAVCLVLMPYLSSAQTLPVKQKWQANTRVLECVQQYEINADMHDSFAERDFMRLFQSEDILIFCDLLDYKCGERIPLREYVSELAKRENISYEIKDLSLSDPEYSADGWHIIASFSKTMIYTRGSVLFSSSEYFDQSYDMKADFLYDQASGSCKLVSLDGTNSSRIEPLGDHFLVVQRNDARTNPKSAKMDDKLSIHGDRLFFNSFGQAFVDGIIESNDEDMVIVTDVIERNPEFDYVSLSYKSTHWRIRPYTGFALTGPFKFSSAMSFKSASSGYEAGLDFGYMFPLDNGFHAGLFIGAAVSNSSVDFSYNSPFTYGINTYDSNGKPVERIYSIDSMNESVDYSHLAIPVYISLNRSIAKGFGVEACAGIKYYHAVGIGPNGYRISGSVNGTSIDSYFNKFLSPRSYRPEPFELSMKFGFGASYALLKKKLYLNLRIEYENGLTDFHKSDENSLYNQLTGEYPLVYSAMSKEDIATRSFIDCVSIRRNAIWGQAGLIFKF